MKSRMYGVNGNGMDLVTYMMDSFSWCLKFSSSALIMRSSIFCVRSFPLVLSKSLPRVTRSTSLLNCRCFKLQGYGVVVLRDLLIDQPQKLLA